MSVAVGEEESWEHRVKRVKLERQEEVSLAFPLIPLSKEVKTLVMTPLTQARVAAGHLQETTVENLVDGYLFSDIQEDCLK